MRRLCGRVGKKGFDAADLSPAISRRRSGAGGGRVTDEILTASELAGLLKVADKTVYTMAQRGELPAFKVRGRWGLRRTDLNAWIDAGTRGGPSEEESK
jgi:excisionase family DNA binding protein